MDSTPPYSSEVVDEDIRSILDFDVPWERLAGCKVVVTGAAGFLGHYLIRTLLALYPAGRVSAPVDVVAMVRHVERANARFARVSHPQYLSIQQWDLNQLLVPDLGGANYVIHAASQASPRFYGIDPVGTMLPNIVGTAALLESLQRGEDPRGFVFVSSSEVYGSVDGVSNVSETEYGNLDPALGRSCYGESKRAGEALCVAWQRQHGLPVSIVRPFHTYGPGLGANDGRVFADFAYNAARNENIVMTSEGTARRAFCYVSDAIHGMFVVMLKGEPGIPYNLANRHAELSVMELAELIVGLFPQKALQVEHQVRTHPDARGSVNRMIPNTDRIEGLGWAPAITPEAGFERMIRDIESRRHIG